jgi:hypothetical protein
MKKDTLYYGSIRYETTWPLFRIVARDVDAFETAVKEAIHFSNEPLLHNSPICIYGPEEETIATVRDVLLGIGFVETFDNWLTNDKASYLIIP